MISIETTLIVRKAKVSFSFDFSGLQERVVGLQNRWADAEMPG